MKERIEPKAGQESVWDYPRPPALESTEAHIRILFEGSALADSRDALRILETSHPPVYYIPRRDIEMDFLNKISEPSYCEWKGQARYFDLQAENKRSEKAAWTYPDPKPDYKDIKNHIAFYPQKVDVCYVDDEKVDAQAGGFYGGWITDDIVGPFKGPAGTAGW